LLGKTEATSGRNARSQELDVLELHHAAAPPCQLGLGALVMVEHDCDCGREALHLLTRQREVDEQDMLAGGIAVEGIAVEAGHIPNGIAPTPPHGPCGTEAVVTVAVIDADVGFPGHGVAHSSKRVVAEPLISWLNSSLELINVRASCLASIVIAAGCRL